MISLQSAHIGRRRLAIVAFAILSLLLISWLQREKLPLTISELRFGRFSGAPSPHAYAESWKRLSTILERHKPPCQPPGRLGNANITSFSTINHDAVPQYLNMTAEDVASMKQAHAAFLASITTEAAGLLTYKPKSRGIVTTAGGRYLPVFVISIKMLRRTGCKLPVEVFLFSHEEYESYSCETILPPLGAKCIVIRDLMGNATLSSDQFDGKTSRYALKVFALAFSSFENNLFLDADDFPLRDPEPLLRSEPYLSKGLVLWPDFWRPTVSPHFFDIASMAPIPPDLRSSTEAGQILISKSSHQSSLLLALYYNVYGAAYYYPLLSQGSIGEGDKETFSAAAVASHQPFHAVTEPVRAVGHFKPDGKLSGSAMVQYDPVEDYARTRNGLPEGFTGDTAAPASIRPFFVHANFPKFDPATIFGHLVDPTKAPSGEFWPVWVDRAETVESLGPDVERHFWDTIREVACMYSDPVRFKSWEGKEGICANVEAYLRGAFGEGVVK